MINRMNNDYFRVLVKGAFTSGKSSLINVLLDETILHPSWLSLPYDLITEFCYGEKKKVIVYPFPDMWEGGDEPFEIKPEEIDEYRKLQNTHQFFQRMVIYWPSPFLYRNISITEIPHNHWDPVNHLSDIEFKFYFPKAKAIVYCIGSTIPFSQFDKRELEGLISLSYKVPLIFAITRFDHIDDEDMEIFLDFINQTSLRYTDLGEDAIFYLNSLKGLAAKKENNHAKLVDSGYFGLEQFIKKLANGKSNRIRR